MDPRVLSVKDVFERIEATDTQRSSFHVTQSQLKEKLFNMLFLLDLSAANSSKYRRAIFNNARAVFIAQTLSLFGMSELAVRTAKSGLKEAETFELTSNAIHFLRILRSHATQAGKRDEHTKLSTEIKRYVAIYSAELEGRDLWEELAVELSVTGSANVSLALQAKASSKRLTALYKRNPTFNIGLLYYRLTATCLEIHGEFRAAATLCSRAKEFLDGYPQFRSPSLYGEFAMKRLDSSLHSGDYASALQAAAQCRSMYSQGDPNWFVYMEYEFLLRMHLLRFDDAAKAFDAVRNDPRFEGLAESREHRWTLFEFYLEYAQGKYSDRDFAIRRLAALRRFRSASTAYLKDKTGFNFSILIIEMLILLESKQYKLVEERVDAMAVYRQRYMKQIPSASMFLLFLMDVARKLDAPTPTKKSPAIERKTEPTIKSSSSLEGMQILPFSWVRAKILRGLSPGR
ncbi:MAG: hypothetical protein ABI444_03815 [Candidatus Kapaibacterium sp.]